MKLFWRLFALLSIVPFFALKAHATWMEVNPVFGINAAAPTQQQSNTSLGWTGNTVSSFGLLSAVNLFDSRFDAELGAVYLAQSSGRSLNGSNVTEETHALHIPLVIRYNFDERVALGAGIYGSYGKGNVTTIQNTSTQLKSYYDSNLRNQDYGLLLSARANIAITPGELYFIIDGRYQHGLTNLASTPGDVRNTRSMQAYLGLSYAFQI